MEAALREKATVFLCSDGHVGVEGAYEDLNALLNNGDVPNLYGPEEVEAINAACRKDCVALRLQPTRINVFAQVGY